MTNEQRRLALAKARLKALEYAEAVEAGGQTLAEMEAAVSKSSMWSGVAQAMKIGPNIQADGSGPEPPDGEPFVNRPAFETR